MEEKLIILTSNRDKTNIFYGETIVEIHIAQPELLEQLNKQGYTLKKGE